jgi:hypothetical protein
MTARPGPTSAHPYHPPSDEDSDDEEGRGSDEDEGSRCSKEEEDNVVADVLDVNEPKLGGDDPDAAENEELAADPEAAAEEEFRKLLAHNGMKRGKSEINDAMLYTNYKECLQYEIVTTSQTTAAVVRARTCPSFQPLRTRTRAPTMTHLL